MPVRPHKYKLSFVSVTDQALVDVNDVERYAAHSGGALETFAIACVSEAQQSEAAAEKIEHRLISAEPRMGRSPAGPRRRMINLGIVRLRRRAVGDADR